MVALITRLPVLHYIHQHIIGTECAALLVDAGKIKVHTILQANVESLVIRAILAQGHAVLAGFLYVRFLDFKVIHASILGFAGLKGHRVATDIEDPHTEEGQVSNPMIVDYKVRPDPSVRPVREAARDRSSSQPHACTAGEARGWSDTARVQEIVAYLGEFGIAHPIGVEFLIDLHKVRDAALQVFQELFRACLDGLLEARALTNATYGSGLDGKRLPTRKYDHREGMFFHQHQVRFEPHGFDQSSVGYRQINAGTGFVAEHITRILASQTCRHLPPTLRRSPGSRDPQTA